MQSVQTENISKLLDLQYKLFDLDNFSDIVDFIVNDTYKIIDYQLAVFIKIPCTYNNKLSKLHLNHVDIINISGNLSNHNNIDNTFNKWLKSTIYNILLDCKNIDINNNKLIIIHPEDLSLATRNNWQDSLGQELLIANLCSGDKKSCKLVIINNKKYLDDKLLFFNLLVKSYQQILKLNICNDNKNKVFNFINNKKFFNFKKIVQISIFVLILLLFIPIKPSVMAPAEIISTQSFFVNSPINGIIDKIYINPNSVIQKEDLLLEFDQLDIINNYKIKEQELKSLDVELKQVKGFGFQDLGKRSEIFRLQQDIKVKQQELLYIKEQLEQSKIKSPANGVVLYKSKNELIGKPVKVGETIMRIADQSNKLIEAWLDINDSIEVEQNSEIYYYSNKTPFTAIKAKLKYSSYEAYVTPSNTIAYRITAEFILNNNNINKNSDLLIGDHGQIKIYSNKKISLFKFLFQRPISSLRQWFYKII